MRILISASLYPPFRVGGQEEVTSLLAEALARRGDEVSVVTLHPSDTETVENRNGVRIYRLPLENDYWPWGRTEKPPTSQRLAWHLRNVYNSAMARRVGGLLDEVRPEIVHTNSLTGFSVSFWREVKRRRIRLVHTMHDYSLMCSRESMYREGGTCLRRCASCIAFTTLQKAWSHRLDAVVSVSAHVLAAHKRKGYFSEVPGSVIFNISGMLQGSPPPRRIAEAKDGLTFGFIGRIAPEKGLEVLLKATRKLRAPDWRLKIAGRGLDGYVSMLQERFPDPRIEWVGYVNPTEFYPAIDCCIVPSLWGEPLPTVLIESMSTGCSVICARSGGIPELASLARTGAVYSAEDDGALAALMDEALADPGRWSSGGFRTQEAAGLFSEDAVVRQYRAVYRGGKSEAVFKYGLEASPPKPVF